MLSLLVDFWSAVRDVFADAWDKPPRQSRLMHGVGIASLGFLMDAIFDRYSRDRIPDEARLSARPQRTQPTCAAGHTDYWDFGPNAQRKWNELQNTSRDIQLLTNYLLYQYKALVWAKPLGRR